MLKYDFKFFTGKNNIISIIILFLLFSLLAIFFCFLYYLYVISTLDDVKDIKELSIAKSSVIYDRNGWELYKIYSEKRTYVGIEEININMINAIVAWEDKRFWTHPWYDKIGILRSIIDWLLNWNNFTWTSWITQQLVKITYLTNERTIERKLKELYISTELSSHFEKKDILELYLNKIFFWWNSYGVEQVSQTYFWKKAIDLWILESSILASLPKAPTWLSPYNNKDKLLGFPVILNTEYSSEIEILSKKDLDDNILEIDSLFKILNNLTSSNKWNYLEICWIDNQNLKNNFNVDINWCINLKYSKLLSFLNSISIKSNNNIISYKTWRKDYVLSRMLEDEYITFDEFIKSITDSFWFEFNNYRDDIKYPHFVMYILNYLNSKYDEDYIKNWWLKIYTTIDPNLQDKAQELIKKQVAINTEKYSAKNAALISLDSKTSEILSMIGWVDYFNEDILGYNNIILARLQPWSSFKPFVYMLAMIKEWFTKNTIFTDAKFTFPWDYTPQNSDWKFMWKMTLSKALNYSRNIPAVKVYYAAWEENEIIKFLRHFWIKSLDIVKEEFKEKYWFNYVYAAPMALWTVQITPLELAWAYSVFANNWVKNKITPILKIIDFNWNIIEESNFNNEWIQVIERKMSFEMNSILSNTNDRPKIWNYFLTIPGRQMAAKTGTSSKQYKKEPEDKEDTIVPKDMWTVWYTPQITTVVWAWNNNWEELEWDAFWMNWAGPIMRDFMTFAHEGLDVETWKK